MLRIENQVAKPNYIRIMDYILKYHAWVPRYADECGPIWSLIGKCVKCTSSWFIMNNKLVDVACWIIQEGQGEHD